jgi:hypothetical protein
MGCLSRCLVEHLFLVVILYFYSLPNDYLFLLSYTCVFGFLNFFFSFSCYPLLFLYILLFIYLEKKQKQ